EAIFQAREKMLKDAFETEMRLAEAQTADFVEGVTAKLVDKRPALWKPATLNEVKEADVQSLLNSDAPLPEGFVLANFHGHAGKAQKSYGLPKEEEIEKILKMKSRSMKELMEELEYEYRGKQGLRERVEEIARRKTRLEGDRLVWKTGGQ
ncbi:2683_t:CDS:2, partial [Acaulospora colombiana]